MRTSRGTASRGWPQAADERQLVEAAQRDPARFDALYELHFERVYAFIASRVRDRASAEDLTSDVFHKALANLDRYEYRGAPFAAWLYRIAANAIFDQAKRASREASSPDGLSDWGDDSAPPEADLDLVECRAQVFLLVRQLPEPQRSVVIQRFVEQRSIREIARHLGKSEGAVKQLQFRAMQSLRAQIGGAHA